jgi:hypothetical protein
MNPMRAPKNPQGMIDRMPDIKGDSTLHPHAVDHKKSRIVPAEAHPLLEVELFFGDQ